MRKMIGREAKMMRYGLVLHDFGMMRVLEGGE